ncbi:hypothetical protein [Vibrio algarum]|uniref:Uncharacterized protein n=1 Tax=Vibrio algarum TaxID=3020714 RepID=A0ABT4YWS4_9VIBR|nr:hypothetical protein [Vibrio sp. KJ40-1]MDB1125443.1 hypothetical protein [Vibrio sp. KJ40-1]
MSCIFLFCTAPYNEIKERHLLSVEKSIVTLEGESARLVSGGDLSIDATTIQNQASHIASGNDVVINTDQLENSAYVDETVTTYGDYQIEEGTFKGEVSWAISMATL